jgi:GMP synthase-like glutamine amidotransferase
VSMENANSRRICLVASAYEYESVKWISNLVSYIATPPTISPSLKIVGTCFGHQVISIAFGSTCEKNALGWEIGVRTLELTQFGSRIFGGVQTLVSAHPPLRGSNKSLIHHDSGRI